MEEFREFRDCVMRHSEEHKHEKKSTFAICTSIQPPKHMCFNEEDPYPHLQNGKNKKAIIQSLNAEIIKMNESAGVWAPRLHIYGIKVTPGKNLHKHHDTAKDYSKEKPAWWKEPELHKRLHFTKKRRAEIAMKIAKHLVSVKNDANYGGFSLAVGEHGGVAVNAVEELVPADSVRAGGVAAPPKAVGDLCDHEPVAVGVGHGDVPAVLDVQGGEGEGERGGNSHNIQDEDEVMKEIDEFLLTG